MNNSKPIRTMLKQAITNKETSIKAFKDDKNPQVKEQLIRAEAQKEAFEAVLFALRGNTCNLRIFAGSNDSVLD